MKAINNADCWLKRSDGYSKSTLLIRPRLKQFQRIDPKGGCKFHAFQIIKILNEQKRDEVDFLFNIINLSESFSVQNIMGMNYNTVLNGLFALYSTCCFKDLCLHVVLKYSCTGALSRPCSLISCVLLAQIWRQQPPCHSPPSSMDSLLKSVVDQWLSWSLALELRLSLWELRVDTYNNNNKKIFSQIL